MRVTFVDNLLLEQNGGRYDTVLQPHLGLVSLIAVAEQAGHHGTLYDPKIAVSRGGLALDRSLFERIAHHILDAEPDVVGLTSLGCNFICTLNIARQLKRLRPTTPLLLGGPHATVLDRRIAAEFDVFDVVVRHEAEMTLLPLLDALGTGRLGDVPGITYRQGSSVQATPGQPLIDDLDVLPHPAYSHYPIKELGLQWLRVEAGRGCPFMCTFCSTASFFGRRYRLRSAQRLCEELDALHEQYGIRHFSLQHDLFTVNRAKVIDFCAAVRERGYTWKCSARMDCVDPELLQIMREAGCTEIYFGIETGSLRMQRIAKKRLDLALFAPTLDAVDTVGMNATVSFITGYPQEELDDQKDTLDLIGSCFRRSRPPHNVQLHMMTPEPGTELLEEFEGALAFDGHISDFNFPLLDAADVDVIRSHPDVFMNHHYFKAVLPRERHVFVTVFYYRLYELGPTVLAHLIDRFGGRLSDLVDAAYRYWQADGRANPAAAPPLDEGFLKRFVSSSLGDDDYIVSLVRYMSAITPLASKAFGRPQPSSRDLALRVQRRRERRYRLSPRAVVLRSLHNCPELLRRLELARHRDAALPALRVDGLRGRRWHEREGVVERLGVQAGRASCVEPPLALRRHRADYLVFKERHAVNRLRNFALESHATECLEAAKSSLTRRQLHALLGRSAEATAAARSFVSEMIRLGVLEPEWDAALQIHEPVLRSKTLEWGDSGARASC
jgi:radical SAM superfamily enzyme YgiQ (UPF0313 family)